MSAACHKVCLVQRSPFSLMMSAYSHSGWMDP